MSFSFLELVFFFAYLSAAIIVRFLGERMIIVRLFIQKLLVDEEHAMTDSLSIAARVSVCAC